MARPLPLQQIRAFDAAARWLSFSRAARELNVQQPAISRQVAALEAELGTRLFLRSKPSLTLTEDGRLLAKAVNAGFETIREAFAALQARQEDDTVMVSASIGFTSLYLLPRLAEFQAAFPEIKLQVMTRDQNEDFDVHSCDVVILFGEGGLSGTDSRLVFRETMIAVCHPDLLPDRTPFELAELAERKLLNLTSPDHRGDWNRYFAKAGITVPTPPAHDGYVSYMVYLRAIQNGLGIGIGWQPMMSEYLANRTLVRACHHQCTTTRGYFCSITPQGEEKPGSEQFRDWIGQSLSEPS
ncbi:LysR substrate-binding domain-containing protein [Lutimaribacter marinistellae]|uniref:LysR substrate-binding domain-containing protein n=1 Tax=Lutimaribacter marinistellae TaxID=1820329 RepID=A0ABV7TGX6_9RHOB